MLNSFASLLTACMISAMIPKANSQLEVHNYHWRSADTFSISETRLENSTVLARISARSFLGCCVQCLASEGCDGIAYRSKECNLVNKLAVADHEDASVEYKVIMHGFNSHSQIIVEKENVTVGKI